MTRYLCRYTLRTGQRGVLHLIAASSAEAVIAALDALGDALRTCSVRPSPAAELQPSQQA